MMETHSQRAHARLSPSGAHRWMMCPGSVRMETGLPDRATAYAAEGTAAHELAADCIRYMIQPEDFLGGSVDIETGKVYFAEGRGEEMAEGVRTYLDYVNGPQFKVLGGSVDIETGKVYFAEGRGIAIDEEMAEGVRTYLDYVNGPQFKDYEKAFEEHVSLAHFGIEGMEGGTADALLYHEGYAHLVVVDFKYGRGVAVEPEENPQGMSYALGAVERYHNKGVSTVTVAIVQPRSIHHRGPVREWSGSVVDLAEFAHALVAAAKATQVADAPLVAGEWCKFCRATAICPAVREKALTEAMADFDEQSPSPEPTALTPGQLASVLAEVDFIEMWCRRVREHAHAEATEGRCPPGWKLVAKRANRKWREDNEAASVLRDFLTEEQLFTKKMNSPAQIEKLMPGKNKKQRAKVIDPLVIKEPTGTVLAPDDDPRPAVKADAVKEFALNRE